LPKAEEKPVCQFTAQKKSKTKVISDQKPSSFQFWNSIQLK